MGACSGKRVQKAQVPPQKPIIEVQIQKQNILDFWYGFATCLNEIDRNVSNEKTLAKLKSLFQTKGTIEEMITNQSKRAARNNNSDPLSDTAFQYNLYLQIDKINRIISDYLLIDKAFEEQNSQLLDQLAQQVENIEQYRQQTKTKSSVQKQQNQSTNFSNTQVVY